MLIHPFVAELMKACGLLEEKGSFKGDVNIQANKDVQFKVMKRVLYSCATAGYSNINFAVLQKGNLDGKGEPSAATGSP